MTLTFLGNRYEAEQPAVPTDTTSFTTAKYRGIEYRATTTTVAMPTSGERKYRGIAY